MITKDTLPALLANLGFQEKKGLFSKDLGEEYGTLKVNMNKGELVYPEDKGLTINERQTCNFSQNENFVVFECVHRLLSKGYKPEHIELEPKWKVGRGASGGRADILVKNYEGKPLLLIECKTAGNEFKKAWKETLDDGGQLFSYAQQISQTEYLCLYASDFDAKAEQIHLSQRIVSHKDNPQILAQAKDAKSFAKATNVKQRFEVWRDTYQREYTGTGIFEANIQPYQIGKSKYTIGDDTNPPIVEDIKGKYHQFRTILRKHNIARRETAFEVLVNLFLCKIVDEEENKTDLKFYWKGIAYDNYFDFVDRLQELYKIGMKNFLNEDITYISNEEIDSAFWTVKNKRNATKKTIQEYFRELKFFSNNAFSFINVHNEALFNRNAKVLVEIVQMWQHLRLKTKEHNQFLGDMFEFFLDNSIKQSEGQFFTPLPICKFVVTSLPLEQKIKDSSEPLRAIDYACGSGHFLNEYAYQIKPLVARYKEVPIETYYERITGIEKEDRLAKVAKVAAFMYGQDQIKIADKDALDDIPDLQLAAYDVLIANPPFAVEGFLTNLDEEIQERYSLTQVTGLNSNTNTIQCFFIERAQQLMAPGGVVGIIIPSSILSNSDSVHIRTREIILQYFDLVAIAELGSGTFGKTGTNTVVLFLRRKALKPEPAEHYRNRVEDYFEGIQEGDKDLGEYQDLYLIKRYCEQIEVPFEAYRKLLGITADTYHELTPLMETELFQAYRADFEASTRIKNLMKSRGFKAQDATWQERQLNKLFIEYLYAIEQDKLYYFMLAYENPQQVLLVKSPSDNKEQKAFLGYEWSGSKGSEGIRYTGGETLGDILTPLFDPQDPDQPGKINYAIRQNFLGTPPKDLPEHCSLASVVDLLDFEAREFGKVISTTPKVSLKLETKWDVVRLDEVVGINQASANPIDLYGENDFVYIDISSVTSGTGEVDFTNRIIPKEAPSRARRIVGKGDVLMSTVRPNLKAFAILGELPERVLASTGFAVLTPVQGKILGAFLYELLFHDLLQQQMISKMGKGQYPSVNQKDISGFKIPLPPLDIQQQIVAACQAVDEEVAQAREEVVSSEHHIAERMRITFDSFPKEKIESLNTLLRRGKATKYGDSAIQVIKSGQARGYKAFDFSEHYFAKPGFKLDVRQLQKGDLLINSTGKGTAGRVTLFELEGTYVVDSHITIFRPNEKILPLFALYSLAHIGFATIEGMAKGSTGQVELTLDTIANIQLPLPPLADQQALVAELSALEAQIAAAQARIASAPGRKEAILQEYL